MVTFPSQFSFTKQIHQGPRLACLSIFLLLSSFFSPQESDLPISGGIHYGFAWRCFQLLGPKLKFIGVDRGFPHSPGSTGSGHFLYTIVSRLDSCCKFSPLASLLDNHMGVRSTKVRTIVCTPWISPLRGLNPRPTRDPSQTPLLLVFIGTIVPILTCMGHRPNFSQCVNNIRHSVDANQQSRTRIFDWQAMYIPMSLSPNSRVTGLSYQYRSSISEHGFDFKEIFGFSNVLLCVWLTLRKCSRVLSLIF